MIKVEFCADSVSQLKKDIIDYAKELSPTIPYVPMVTYPPTVPTEEPKKRTRRSREEIDRDNGVVSATPPPANTSTPTSAPPAEIVVPETQTVPVPTDPEVQKALVAVNDKFGIDKAIECLTKFGVKRGRELVDSQKADFVALCKSVLG